MADEQGKDNYASIIVDCRYTSSQEELLSHAKFAREDETFSVEEEPPWRRVEYSRRKLDVGDELGRKRGGEFVGGDAGNESLGFRGERKRAREGVNCGEEREIESQLKKTRVSPVVHCSGKVMIEGKEGNDKEKVIAFSGDLMVDIGSSSRRAGVIPEGSGCTEKLDSERLGFEDGVREESGVKKELKFVMDTKVINLEDSKEIEGGNGEKGNVDKEEGEEGRGEGSGKVDGDDEQGGGMSVRREEEENATRRGKRELPPSMFGVGWGEGSGNGNGNENGNRDLEGGLKEISEEGKRDGEFKGGEDNMFKCILDVLKMIVASEECSNDKSEVDLFETAKRLGMTFPRSRFLPEVEEDK